MKRIITVHYELRTKDANGMVELQETTKDGEPLVFCTEMNLLLPAMEQRLTSLNDGEEFDFIIPLSEAFGERDERLQHRLPQANFMTNGRLDTNNIFVGNVIHMQDSKGHHFNAAIVAMDDETVTVDLNHPLAGKDLHFTGKVIDNHVASEEEAREFEPHHHCGHCHHGEGGEHHCCHEHHGHCEDEGCGCGH
ncbi:MAG: FKBP-type peptidyl-prolyl cis-trans isomerase [Paludibacteraceae bacterium]|nr:FKBP-type peptidyl-prolyl cis-trans isomerase [Paludibacteraceae bacterium]